MKITRFGEGTKVKRLFGILLTVMVLYAIYYDLSQGTLPVDTMQQRKQPRKNKLKLRLPYFEEKVVAVILCFHPRRSLPSFHS